LGKKRPKVASYPSRVELIKFATGITPSYIRCHFGCANGTSIVWTRIKYFTPFFTIATSFCIFYRMATAIYLTIFYNRCSPVAIIYNNIATIRYHHTVIFFALCFCCEVRTRTYWPAFSCFSPVAKFVNSILIFSMSAASGRYYAPSRITIISI